MMMMVIIPGGKERDVIIKRATFMVIYHGFNTVYSCSEDEKIAIVLQFLLFIGIVICGQ